jgi:hypothetical protein
MGHLRRQSHGRYAHNAAVEVWSQLRVLSLNYQYRGHFSSASWRHSRCVNATQAAAYSLICGSVVYFIGRPLEKLEQPDFKKEVVSTSVNYNLDECGRALPLKLLERMPRLPAEGVAGSLPALDFGE